MRLTIVGCGDAFGSGGRSNTCFWVETERVTFALDFGASAPVALKQRGLSVDALDLVVLSHLHGDHFGGLPFLFLECQFVRKRSRPLTIMGPVGTRARVETLCEAMFPGSFANAWRFPIEIVDLPCGEAFAFEGLEIKTAEVMHPSGAPPTAVRIASGRTVLAFSGDTSWTDALLAIAENADLFLVECYMPDGAPVFHGDLVTLEANRARLGAKRIMLTHMSTAMLDRVDEARARGYLIADDGLVVDL